MGLFRLQAGIRKARRLCATTALIALSSVSFSAIAVGLVLEPRPLPITLPPYLSASGSFMNAAIFPRSDPLALAGTVTNPNVAFGYQFGTSSSSNPYVYLDFSGSGAVTYNYGMSFGVEFVGPTTLFAGESVSLTPYLSSLLGSPTLSGTQSIQFDTDLNFGFEIGLLGIDVDATVDIPNFTLPPLSITAEGTTSLTTTGASVLTSPSETCPGCFVAETDRGIASAWAAGIDLLDVADDFVAALAPVDALFDLDLTLGMPIYRTDVLGLWDYRFSNTSVQLCQGVAVGQRCDYEVPVTFTYSLFTSSIFAYGSSLSLDFEGPFGFNENIFSVSGDPFGVGRVNAFFDNLTTQFTLRGSTLVADPSDSGCFVSAGGQVRCFEGVALGLSSLDLASYTDPTLLGAQVLPSFGGNGSTLAYVAPDELASLVPEPGTLLLLATGLLALVAVGRGGHRPRQA